MTDLLPQPPTTLAPADRILNVLQITDLHLHEDPATIIHNNPLQQNFEAVLAQALAEAIRCDLILVTGDLVSEVKPSIYERIYKRLRKTGIPFACIAGNHDVTDETGKQLPFAQRRLIAQPANAELVNHHVITTPDWQILLLDTSVPGQVAGRLHLESMSWLSAQLTRCDKPALLILHHHVLPMQSAWIDAHMAENPEDLWSLLADFPQVRAIVHGHTHQERVLHKQGITVYAAPATSYQFCPHVDEFAYDNEARPGYRWLQLGADGQINSWVQRLLVVPHNTSATL